MRFTLSIVMTPENVLDTDVGGGKLIITLTVHPPGENNSEQTLTQASLPGY